MVVQSQFFGRFPLNFLPLSDLLVFSHFDFLLFRSKGSLENVHFENLDGKRKKAHVLLPQKKHLRFNLNGKIQLVKFFKGKKQILKNLAVNTWLP